MCPSQPTFLSPPSIALSIMSSIVELGFNPVPENQTFGERPVNRSLLLDIAPDREDLILNNSIEGIRNALKLSVE